MFQQALKYLTCSTSTQLKACWCYSKHDRGMVRAVCLRKSCDACNVSRTAVCSDTPPPPPTHTHIHAHIHTTHSHGSASMFPLLYNVTVFIPRRGSGTTLPSNAPRTCDILCWCAHMHPDAAWPTPRSQSNFASNTYILQYTVHRLINDYSSCVSFKRFLSCKKKKNICIDALRWRKIPGQTAASLALSPQKQSVMTATL